MSVDLETFRRSGGKLILWHGWGDQAIPPTETLDYYQRLWQHNGGLADTQEWARVFLIPTMAHCLGGYQLTEFDPFGHSSAGSSAAPYPTGSSPRRGTRGGTKARGSPAVRGDRPSSGGTGGVALRRCGVEAGGDVAGLGRFRW